MVTWDTAASVVAAAEASAGCDRSNDRSHDDLLTSGVAPSASPRSRHAPAAAKATTSSTSACWSVVFVVNARQPSSRRVRASANSDAVSSGAPQWTTLVGSEGVDVVSPPAAARSTCPTSTTRCWHSAVSDASLATGASAVAAAVVTAQVVLVKHLTVPQNSSVLSQNLQLVSVDFGGGRRAVQISVTDTGTCALLDDDHVVCFGQNSNSGRFKHNAPGAGTDPMVVGTHPSDMGSNLTNLPLPPGRHAASMHLQGDSVVVILDNHEAVYTGMDRSYMGIPAPPDGGATQPLDLGVQQALAGQEAACVLRRSGLVLCQSIVQQGEGLAAVAMPLPLAFEGPVQSIDLFKKTVCGILVNTGRVQCFGESPAGLWVPWEGPSPLLQLGQYGETNAPTAA